MEKRKTALWLFLFSLLFILVSMESVTGTGILEKRITNFQTISPFGRYFNLYSKELVDKVILFDKFAWFFRILFIAGVLMLYISNLILCFKQKSRKIALIVVDTVGMIVSVGLN